MVRRQIGKVHCVIRKWESNTKGGGEDESLLLGDDT